MLILDKRKAIERVVALTVEGAAADPEPRPRRGRRPPRSRARRERAATPALAPHAAPADSAAVAVQEPAHA